MTYCFGESLYDIVFQDNQPKWALPGGGMLNGAISLARAGEQVELISEIGNDTVADLITEFLHSNKVGTSFFKAHKNNSTLALAFLDEHGNAKYQFYFSHPELAPKIEIPVFEKGDTLMFGSIFSIIPRNRGNLETLVKTAKQQNAVVFYDPNFRQSHLPRLEEVLPAIKKNIMYADIVRGSDEDFKLICNAENGDQAFAFIKASGGKHLIYSRNEKGVMLYTDQGVYTYLALPVEVISTIGAGDAFNAGAVAMINKMKHVPTTMEEWDKVIKNGLSFATEVCGSRNNYIDWKY